jgi:hypothetical protein
MPQTVPISAPGPERGHVPLQERLRHAAPSELLDGAQQEHHEHQRHDRSDTFRRQRRQKRPSLDERPCHVDERDHDEDEAPPGRREAPEQKPGQEGSEALETADEEHDGESSDGGRPCGQKEERVRAADLSKLRRHGVGPEDVTADNAPGDREGDCKEANKLSKGTGSFLRLSNVRHMNLIWSMVVTRQLYVGPRGDELIGIKSKRFGSANAANHVEIFPRRKLCGPDLGDRRVHDGGADRLSHRIKVVTSGGAQVMCRPMRKSAMRLTAGPRANAAKGHFVRM